MGRWDGLNRRQFPRVKFPCLVIIANKESDDKEVILTHTENIGMGGVCVILEQNLKIFSNVDIEVDLLDLNEHIKCKGKVVWNVRRKLDERRKPNYYDIGIEFQDVSKKDTERLDEVVRRLEKHHAERSHPQSKKA